MEVAQFTVKKSLIKNESGNIVIVIAIIGMIAGAITFWTNLSGKVDKEIRSLGATQSTTYMRADFKNTIRKSLQGRNTLCTLSSSFRDKFKDFQASESFAKLDVTYSDNPATPINEVNTNTEIPCFFNIARYEGINWEKLNITIRRTTQPNYINLSNFIAADITATFKVGGKPTVLKYQLRYRIDVLTMNHYGIIFTNSEAGDLFEIAQSSKLKINSPVLFDRPDRTNNIPLKHLLALPDTGRLIFTQDTFTTAPGLDANDDGITFMANNGLLAVFKRGIHYNQLTKDPGFKAPYEINPDQWNEVLDFYDVINGGYPLPNSSPQAINFNPPSVVYAFNNGIDHSNTAYIYNHMYGGPNNEKLLTASCQKISDLAASVYHLMVHNNLNQDFTIDFTKNTEEDFPPVFCGVVSAKNLIIKLNNQNSTQDFYQHHIVGKFNLKGKIIVENEGSLNIHDMMSFTEDLITYPAINIDVTNLRTQFYNQKYYSTQNFFLPFFISYPAPLPALMGADNNKFYVPRSTKTFFNRPCNGSKLCRNHDIPTPPMEHLAQTHWQQLMFEVFDVE